MSNESESEASFGFKEKRRIMAQIDDIAEKRGTDRSAIIREALRQYLEREMPKT